MATTFEQFSPGETAGYDYSRSGNPTRKVLESCLAALDNAKYGLTFSSGMAAITSIISTVKSGELIIAGDDIYSGTSVIFKKIAVSMGIEVIFVDITNLGNLEAAIKPNLKLVWVETPTNPIVKIVDIRAAAAIVKKTKAFMVVDNTFLSPYFQRPLELGADIVVYSLTKYMNGHSDVLMGAITTSNDELHEQIKFYQNATGIVPSPFECYLVNRGLKTLSLRMEQHFKNSLAIARFLEAHAKVDQVWHPSLPSHPHHKLALAQSFGHSGIMSFHIKDTTLDMTSKFLKSLKVYKLAVSLGGVDSLVELPRLMTHVTVPVEHLNELGIDEGLIRMSVGLEDVEDLIADLKQALALI